MLADYRIPMEDAEVDIDFSAKSAVAISLMVALKRLELKREKLSFQKKKFV